MSGIHDRLTKMQRDQRLYWLAPTPRKEPSKNELRAMLAQAVRHTVELTRSSKAGETDASDH